MNYLNEDDDLIDNEIDPTRNGRINEVEVADVLKKDPRDVLYSYLGDRLKEQKRTASPEYRNSLKEDRQQNLNAKLNLDLAKSVSDFGASFGNRRYSDHNSAIPESSFNPETTKKYLSQAAIETPASSIDPRILLYLAQSKDKEALLNKSIDAKNSQLDKTLKARENAPLTPYQQETLKLQKEKNLIDAGKTSPEKKSFEALPPDKQRVATDLSAKNANKISILNQVGSFLDSWDNWDEKEKLQQGREMIKVLNSKEGQDAVGAEEAKRLAGKLNFAYGNITNDNPTQFGRDLEGFKNDAFNTYNSMVDAVNSNQKQIESITGRKEGNIVTRKQPAAAKASTNEVFRVDPKTGKTAIFDAATKKFLRYKD